MLFLDEATLMPNSPQKPNTSTSALTGETSSTASLKKSPAVSPSKRKTPVPDISGPMPASGSASKDYATSSNSINEFMRRAPQFVQTMEDSYVFARQVCDTYEAFHAGISEMAAGAAKAVDAVTKRDNLFMSIPENKEPRL